MSMPSLVVLNQVALSNTIRRLWVDNSQWIRAYIYSILYGIGDRAAIEARMGRVAEGLGMFFEQYYGEEIGRKVSSNYMRYIQELARMVEAYRDGDVALVSSQREVLYDIADELAALYAHVNRFLDQPTIQIMLYELINITEKEITSILTSNYAQEIEAHDQLMDQAYRLADETASGVYRQFRI